MVICDLSMWRQLHGQAITAENLRAYRHPARRTWVSWHAFSLYSFGLSDKFERCLSKVRVHIPEKRPHRKECIADVIVIAQRDHPLRFATLLLEGSTVKLKLVPIHRQNTINRRRNFRSNIRAEKEKNYETNKGKRGVHQKHGANTDGCHQYAGEGAAQSHTRTR